MNENQPNFVEARVLDQLNQLLKIKSAAVGLIRAMDHVLGEQWRDETLNAGDKGDEVNWAWDLLIDVLGQDGKPTSDGEPV